MNKVSGHGIEGEGKDMVIEWKELVLKSLPWKDLHSAYIYYSDSELYYLVIITILYYY